MKYRIIRKKLKRCKLLELWLKSSNEWSRVFQNTSDGCIKNIAADFLRYDWTQILKIGERMGFSYRIMNRFYNEWIHKHTV